MAGLIRGDRWVLVFWLTEILSSFVRCLAESTKLQLTTSWFQDIEDLTCVL